MSIYTVFVDGHGTFDDPDELFRIVCLEFAYDLAVERMFRMSEK
jgi:hypothetical protein